jgi:hypothetical protein
MTLPPGAAPAVAPKNTVVTSVVAFHTTPARILPLIRRKARHITSCLSYLTDSLRTQIERLDGLQTCTGSPRI